MNLLQEYVLDSLEVKEIRSQTTDHDKIALLLQFILRTTKEQFEKVLEVLNKTNHKHVCHQLEACMPSTWSYVIGHYC